MRTSVVSDIFMEQFPTKTQAYFLRSCHGTGVPLFCWPAHLAQSIFKVAASQLVNTRRVETGRSFHFAKHRLIRHKSCRPGPDISSPHISSLRRLWPEDRSEAARERVGESFWGGTRTRQLEIAGAFTGRPPPPHRQRSCYFHLPCLCQCVISLSL